MHLEYRVFARDVKASADTPGQFTGKASVYGVVDSYGDVVMPGAFTKTLAQKGNRIKVLSQHDPSAVIGMATLADSADALLVTDGRLVLDLPEAKDMHTRMVNGLIDGISIGYVTKNATYDKSVRQLTEIDLWEVSLVTFPANDYARVTGVKSRRQQKAGNVDQSVADALSAIDAQIDDLDDAFDALLAQLGIADPDEDSAKSIVAKISKAKAAILASKAGAQFSSANAAKITAAYEAVVTAGAALKELKDAIDGIDSEKAAQELARKSDAERVTLFSAVKDALGKLNLK